MDDTFKAVRAYDWGQSRTPLLEIDREIRNVYGHPEHLAKLEANLLEVLNSDASLGSKRFVCQKLGVIGSEQSVPVLAAMLTNPETSDIARYALERIPADIVDKAFRAALNSTSGKTKAGIIDSLGMRKDREAAVSLGPLLADADPVIATSAAWALGQIGVAAAIEQLSKAKGSVRGDARLAILHACLACAEHSLADGNKSQAVAIYNELKSDGTPEVIRRAAQRGLETAKV